MDIPAERIRTLKLHIVFLKFSQNKDILIYSPPQKKEKTSSELIFVYCYLNSTKHCEIICQLSSGLEGKIAVTGKSEEESVIVDIISGKIKELSKEHASMNS